MIVTLWMCFLLTADSTLILILRIIKQEVRSKRKRHVVPLFSLFIPRDSFWWWEQGLHNKQQHTHTKACACVWDPGNRWNSMRMFWKRRKLPGTTDRAETVKGAVHLKCSCHCSFSLRNVYSVRSHNLSTTTTTPFQSHTSSPSSCNCVVLWFQINHVNIIWVVKDANYFTNLTICINKYSPFTFY